MPDLRGEHRAEPVPPEADRLVAHVDAALVEQVLDVPEREREPDVEHHRKPNVSGDVLKYRKGLGLLIARGYAAALPRSSALALTEPLAAVRHHRRSSRFF